MIRKGGKRGDEGLNTTQVAIIAIVAILVVAAAALISFGKSGNTGIKTGGPGPTATATNAIGVQRTLNPDSIKVPTTVSIADTGIFIRVQYMGSYNGSYNADGEVHAIRNSGDRLFTVENSSQTISVMVAKTDRSAKQPLTVEVWKNGKLVKTAGTSDLFGQVNLTAEV